MERKILKNNSIIFNQMRTKLLKKHLNNNVSIRSNRLSLNLNKLRSFNDDVILEGLFLLEFLGLYRSNVTYYKKMYQEVSLQLANIIRDRFVYYFVLLMKLFYFPLLARRNVSMTQAFDINNNYAFTVVNLNSFPALPDIYFKWNTPVNCFFNMQSKSKNHSTLFLQYWNFPISK